MSSGSVHCEGWWTQRAVSQQPISAEESDIQEGFETCFVDQAQLLPNDFSPMEHFDVGDGADFIARGQVRALVDIDLCNTSVGQFACQFLQHGSQLPAGSTPVGIEIDEDRNIGLENQFVEVRLGDVDDRAPSLSADGLVGFSGACGDRLATVLSWQPARRRTQATSRDAPTTPRRMRVS